MEAESNQSLQPVSDPRLKAGELDLRRDDWENGFCTESELRSHCQALDAEVRRIQKRVAELEQSRCGKCGATCAFCVEMPLAEREREAREQPWLEKTSAERIKELESQLAILEQRAPAGWHKDWDKSH